MEITVTKNEFRNLVVSELKDYLEAKMSSEETKVLQFLIKHGANPKEAEKDVKKHYKDAKRIWRGSTPAKLATGAIVKVPLFISEGEVVTIDTRTGEYQGRK